MYCSKCGKEINENSNFCKHCGYETNTNNENIPSTGKNKQDNIGKNNGSNNIAKSIISTILIIIIGTAIGLWIVYKNAPDHISTYYAKSNRGNSITICDFNDSKFKKLTASHTKAYGTTFSNKVTAVGINNTIKYYIVVGWSNNSNYYYVGQMYPGFDRITRVTYTETAYPRTKTIDDVISLVTSSLGVYEYATFNVSNI